MQVYLWISFGIAFLYLLLMAIYAIGFLIGSKKTKIEFKQTSEYFFSIIIPARNEAQQIEACLNSILANDFPKDKFEIILMDDFSDDDTVAIATHILGAAHKVLQLSNFINLEERLNAYKKKALEIGIAHAKGNYIITTDADCIVPKTWLASIQQKLASNADIHCLAAPVNFIPINNSKNGLYYFQSIDFMTMQGITIASNRLKLGNMSNGANFVFSKQAFEAVDGYKNIDHKASGDDMMLMQKISSKFPGSIDFLFDKSAIVNTAVQPTWQSFMNQRIRWASKADSYPQARLTWALLLVYVFNVNFLILGIMSLFNIYAAKCLLVIFLMKLVAELIFVIPLSKFFNKFYELIFLIILQPLHILYIISAGFLGKFGRYTWKGRSVT